MENLEEKVKQVLKLREVQNKQLEELRNQAKKEIGEQKDEETKKQKIEDWQKKINQHLAEHQQERYKIIPCNFLDKNDYQTVLRHAPKWEHLEVRIKGVPADSYHYDKSGAKKQGILYLPIGKQESLADFLFSHWDTSDLKYQELGEGAVIATIKLFYTPDYPNAEERTAVGSISGKPSAKQAEGFAGKLKSQALSNAFESIGNIFGRNTGRPNEDNDFVIG